jgi:hypothetical protein
MIPIVVECEAKVNELWRLPCGVVVWLSMAHDHVTQLDIGMYDRLPTRCLGKISIRDSALSKRRKIMCNSKTGIAGVQSLRKCSEDDPKQRFWELLRPELISGDTKTSTCITYVPPAVRMSSCLVTRSCKLSHGAHSR